MRRPVDASRVFAFIRALGERAKGPGRVYLTGGSSAVLIGWRKSTVDIDLSMQPQRDDVLREIPKIKEDLSVNLELAAPSDFIPEVPGWVERSRFIAQEGPLAFFHYDFYSQALSKIERGHQQDLEDVRQMVSRGLVEPDRLLELFRSIEPELYRYPALDPSRFRRAVERAADDLRPT